MIMSEKEIVTRMYNDGEIKVCELAEFSMFGASLGIIVFVYDNPDVGQLILLTTAQADEYIDSDSAIDGNYGIIYDALVKNNIIE